MTRTTIKQFIEELRRKHSLNTFPADLDELAKIAGAEVRFENFDDELSGFAFQKSSQKIIGVNSSHSEVRQRFTIAHELGHIFLHQKTINYDEASVLLRDMHSSDGTDPNEIEANRFAAELLMPEGNIQLDIQRLGQIDLEDDDAIEALADKYQVSKQAMTIRLTSLYFREEYS